MHQKTCEAFNLFVIWRLRVKCIVNAARNRWTKTDTFQSECTSPSGYLITFLNKTSPLLHACSHAKPARLYENEIAAFAAAPTASKMKWVEKPSPYSGIKRETMCCKRRPQCANLCFTDRKIWRPDEKLILSLSLALPCVSEGKHTFSRERNCILPKCEILSNHLTWKQIYSDKVNRRIDDLFFLPRCFSISC